MCETWRRRLVPDKKPVDRQKCSIDDFGHQNCIREGALSPSTPGTEEAVAMACHLAVLGRFPYLWSKESASPLVGSVLAARAENCAEWTAAQPAVLCVEPGRARTNSAKQSIAAVRDFKPGFPINLWL
jgi:hypothetical protein